MCFWRKKKPEPVAEQQPAVEPNLTEPLFAIDMVPVEPSSVSAMRPKVRPEDFLVYTKSKDEK